MRPANFIVGAVSVLLAACGQSASPGSDVNGAIGSGVNGTSSSSGVNGASSSSGVNGTSGSSGVNGTSGSSGAALLTAAERAAFAQLSQLTLSAPPPDVTKSLRR